MLPPIILRTMQSFEPPSEWVSKYWQWLYSFRDECSPLKTGQISIQSVKGEKFICFPCTGGGTDLERSVILPKMFHDSNMLIPVFTAAYAPHETRPMSPTNTLILNAREDVLSPESLELVVDNRCVKPMYVESEQFPVSVTMIEEFVLKSYETVASSAGFWIGLRPFSLGLHTIRFGGLGRNGFSTKVQFSVTVR